MGPKYKMMPDKGTTINFAAIAVSFVMFVLVIFQGIVIAKIQGMNDDLQGFTDYWRHKTDSLSDENFKLYMQVYDLKDSIITLKYGE
jgi:hypothetical protein